MPLTLPAIVIEAICVVVEIIDVVNVEHKRGCLFTICGAFKHNYDTTHTEWQVEVVGTNAKLLLLLGSNNIAAKRVRSLQ